MLAAGSGVLRSGWRGGWERRSVGGRVQASDFNSKKLFLPAGFPQLLTSIDLVFIFFVIIFYFRVVRSDGLGMIN